MGTKKRVSPWKLGGLTWRQLARRTWVKVVDDDVVAHAGQLSYFFIFSLFPLLFFLSSLLGYFAQRESELRQSLFRYLSAVVPGKASVLIVDTLDEIIEGSSGGKISFGIIVALWTASFGVGSIISTLNSAYGVRETRPWWKVQLISTGLTILIMLLAASALLIVIYGSGVAEGFAGSVAAGGGMRSVWNVAQWLIVLAFILVTLAVIYYTAPNVEDIRWQWITPGSLLGVALWLLVSFVFRIYLSFYDTYSVTYGSLGAVMILLLWLYLTGAAILVGGELNAVIEDAAAKRGEPEAKEHGETRPGVEAE